MKINVYFTCPNACVKTPGVIVAQIDAETRGEAITKFRTMFLTPNREVVVDERLGYERIYSPHLDGTADLNAGMWTIYL